MPDDAQTAADYLKRAQRLHGEGRIDAAIADAKAALQIDADYVPALSYLGTTLITRKLSYAEGLGVLERAKDVAPEDPGVAYSLGWCYEFVAYRLEKLGRTPLREPQGGAYRDPLELYELAVGELERCLTLEPEEKLREDAEDLLEATKARIE
jgi:tetratricopeptide (TPR) repeat protein